MISKLLMAITMALTALGTPGVTGDVLQAGDHYIMIDDGEFTMWAESNGRWGLQPTPVIVMGKTVIEADSQVKL